MRAKLEDTIEISRAIVHGYYEGNLTPWFERLCSKSAWLGAGERLLLGENAIRDYFADYVPQRPVLIRREEYYPIPLGSRCGAVVAEVTVGGAKAEAGAFACVYTFVYEIVAAETKLILLHAGHEAIRSPAQGDDGQVVQLFAYQFIRDILIHKPEGSRIPIPTGKTTLYVPPHMIFYIKSKKRKTELYCADKVIQSDLTINALNALLPPDFCPVHRCYTVNARYVASIRQGEITMVTGDKVPIPTHGYGAVKQELERKMNGLEAEPHSQKKPCNLNGYKVPFGCLSKNCARTSRG